MRMKHLVGLMVILGLMVFSGCREEVKQYSIEQFMNTTTIFGSSFSHNESKILLSSDDSGIFNAYAIQVEGGKPEQVTSSDSTSIFITSYFPEDDRILFRSNENGNEIWHIFLHEEDGTVRDLTPYDSARAIFYQWSYDRQSFFFGSNKRDSRFMDVYEMDIETFTPQMIYQNDTGYHLGAISNDERYMAFRKTITTHNSDMYLYDREIEEIKHLTPHEGDINFAPVTFSVDSKQLYYLTDKESEFTYLKQLDIKTDQRETVLKTNWDIMYAYFSRQGKYRVVGINNDARTEIKIQNTETKQQVKLPNIPAGNITSVNISDSEKLMSFYVNGSRSPNNLYIYDFEPEHFRKLTDTMNPEIDPDDLVDAKVVRYKSFDGLEVPALMYKPKVMDDDEKVPALVWVHGGPGGQSRIGYIPPIQYLVNHGYAVIAVNNRGSSGYGKTFYQLDDKKHGQDDLADCVQAKKFLAQTGYVDTNRVGIIGASYGGYMVLAALTFRPDAFAVGVDLFGISNWLRTLKSIPPWWEAFREALYKEMGNPETDEEYLRSISPIFHAEKITKPLMVLQGANDPRVLKAESDEIVQAVEEKGVPVKYVLFEDEGHGFVKKENRIEGYKAILDFLDKYLKGAKTQ